jgi:hypothetical protein
MFPVGLLFPVIQDQGEVLEHLKGSAEIDGGLVFHDGDEEEGERRVMWGERRVGKIAPQGDPFDGVGITVFLKEGQEPL